MFIGVSTIANLGP